MKGEQRQVKMRVATKTNNSSISGSISRHIKHTAGAKGALWYSCACSLVGHQTARRPTAANNVICERLRVEHLGLGGGWIALRPGQRQPQVSHRPGLKACKR